MLVNTTEYHLYPVVDTHEPEGVRPVRGFVAAAVTHTDTGNGASAGDLHISFLDADHHQLNSLTAEQVPLFMSAARLVLEELEYPIEPDEWHERGALIQTDVIL